MKVVNLLSAGGMGGIETLCREVAQISTYEDSYIFLFRGGAIYEQMKENGNCVYCLEDTKRLSFKMYKQLVELTKDADIIVIHHKAELLQFYFLLLRKKYPDKKFVYIAHSCFDWMMDLPKTAKFLFRAAVKRYFMRRAIRVADQFVSVSKAGCDSYTKYLKKATRTPEVVYNGIGDKYLNNPVEKRTYTGGTVKLLYVGRLVTEKGIKLLIDSMEIIVKKHDVSLKIVGDGVERAFLENLVKEKNLSNVISFEGSRSNVIDYYKESDIFVYPSTWQEVFGISIVEAMSMGKICVANRVGGIPEIINDGVNGFLTDEASPAGIERAVDKAIEALESNNSIVDEAVATARTFSIDKTVKDLQRVYSNLVAEA